MPPKKKVNVPSKKLTAFFSVKNKASNDASASAGPAASGATSIATLNAADAALNDNEADVDAALNANVALNDNSVAANNNSPPRKKSKNAASKSVPTVASKGSFEGFKEPEWMVALIFQTFVCLHKARTACKGKGK